MTSDAVQPSVVETVGHHATSGSAPSVPKRTGPLPIRFLRALGAECLNDSIDDVGAMMAYYAVLALFPMLVFVVTLALLVLDDQTVLAGVHMVTKAMPYTTRSVVHDTVLQFMHSAHAGFAIGGALLALWGASRGASALGNALNSMFNKVETRSFVRRQLTAIAVTFGVAIGMVLALAMLVIGQASGHWIATHLGLGSGFDAVWPLIRWVGAGVLVMMVWAVLYKFLPNTGAPLRIFTPGALAGVLLWLGVSALFGLYLDHFASYDTTYGTLGGAIIFLTWLWLSNVALLFGAEFNDVLADFRRTHSQAAAQLADTHEKQPPAQ